MKLRGQTVVTFDDACRILREATEELKLSNDEYYLCHPDPIMGLGPEDEHLQADNRERARDINETIKRHT